MRSHPHLSFQTPFAAIVTANRRSVNPDTVGIAVPGCSVTLAVDELSALFGSNCAAVTVAVFEIVPPANGDVITMVNDADPALATS